MQIRVKCPNSACGKVLLVDGDLAGRKGKCSTCGTVFQIPAAGTRPAGRTEPRPAGPTQPAAAPKRPAQARRGSQQSGPAASPGRAIPKRRSPAAGTPRPESRPREDDILEDALLDDALLEEDDGFEAEPPRRQAAAPGAQRSRAPTDADDEHYEDYESGEPGSAGDSEDYEDYDQPARRPSGRSRSPRKRGISTAQRWRRVSVGMFIAAIALCVVAGAFGFVLLTELLFEIALLNLASSEDPASGRGMIEAADAIYKIARAASGVTLLAAAVGYGFFSVAPGKHGAQGLGIATFIAGGGWFVVDLAFRTLPAFGRASVGGGGTNVIYDTLAIAITGGTIYRNSSDKVLCLLLEFVGIACLALLALFLAAAARANRDRAHAEDCMRPVWLLCGHAAAIVVLYVFAFVDWELVRGGGLPWWMYVSWLIHWIANGLYAVVLVFLIKAVFYSRRTTG